MLRTFAVLCVLAGAAGAGPSKLAFTGHKPIAGLAKVGVIRFELDPWNKGEEPRSIVHLDDGATKEIAALHDGTAVVVDAKTAVIVIDYPLGHPVEATLTAAGKGFTRAELVRAACDAYHQIYAEEDAETRIKVVPPDQRGKLLNRNKTDGPYGIWGHDLRDLDLVAITVEKAASGIIYLDLSVDS